MSNARPNLDPEQFLSIVRKSKILSDSQFDFWLNQIEKSAPKIRTSTELISQNLVEQQLMTPWQAKKLLQGKHKGFFIGNYKILQHLGSGGMSSVYLAEQTLSGQQRAIKVLPKDKLKEKSYLARFYREAQSVAKLSHPNIVRVYDVAEHDGTHFMVMEYIRGYDLNRVVSDNGPLELERAIHCILETASGLASAHAAGIIHRDIKPANLLLTHDHQIKILDLGLALLRSEDRKFDISAQHNETIMGTLDYLAPEQAIHSHNIDQRADIYSLGCTLHFLLTGKPPFSSGSLAERLNSHQTQRPPKISESRNDCPAFIESIYEKMMAKQPDARFHDCHSLLEAFRNLDTASNLPPSPKPTRNLGQRKKNKIAWIAIGLLTLFVGILSNMLYQQLRTDREISPPPTITTWMDSLPPLEHPKGGYKFDFSYPESYQRTGRVLQLKANSRIFGILQGVSQRDHKFTITAEGPQMLVHIRAGKKIDFRPDEDTLLLKQINIEAIAVKQTENMQVEFWAKESVSGSDKWKKIKNITSEIGPDGFNEIVLSNDLFTTMDYRKFRISVSGKAGDGVQIKSMSIFFQ